MDFKLVQKKHIVHSCPKQSIFIYLNISQEMIFKILF